MTPLEEATLLANQDPLPPDIVERIAELEEKADFVEKPLFESVWEGLDLNMSMQGLIEKRT